MHRVALMKLLEEEAEREAISAALDAVGFPDFDARGPVILDVHDVVKLIDIADGSCEYMAVPVGWLEELREFAESKKKDVQKKENSRKKRKR